MPNCVSWTASWHHSNRYSIERFAERCLDLLPHYPSLSVNIVDHPTHDAPAAAEYLRGRGLKVYVSPYEDVRDLNAPGAVPLTCNGGQAHVTIDPRGFVYRCLTQLRRADQERWRLGNVFTDHLIWPQVRNICFIPCDQFYILDRKHATRDMWGLDVREVEIPPLIDLEPYRSTFDVPPSCRKAFIGLSPGQQGMSPPSRDSGTEGSVSVGALSGTRS